MTRNLSSRSVPPLHYLWKHSALAGHPRAGRAFDSDRSTLDTEPLIDPSWAYSSGELVLIDLALAIATSSEINLGDLWLLDEENRTVAVEAIRLWMLGDREAVLA